MPGPPNESTTSEVLVGERVNDPAQQPVEETGVICDMQILRPRYYVPYYQAQERLATRLNTTENPVDSNAIIEFCKIPHFEESVQLLCLLSYLDGDNVPDLLLAPDPRFRHDKLRIKFTTPASLDALIRPLVDHSLIEHKTLSRSISILPTVQTAMRSNIEGLADGEKEILRFLTAEQSAPAYWVERAIELVNIAYSSLSSKSPAESEALTSNALCCLTFGKQYRIMTSDLAELQCSLAYYLCNQEAYEEGCNLFEEALRIQECISGVDHPSIVTTLNSLGVTFFKIQRYDQALMLLQRSLYIIRKSSGGNNINIADVLVNLGQIYCAMGKYNDAVSHHHAARIIRENDLDSDQTKLAEIYGFLGEDYFKMARAELAIEYCRRALAIFQSTTQGLKCGRQLQVMETLARSYTSLGIYGQALEVYTYVLDVKSKVFPADHIETADTIHNMGITLQVMGKFDQAIDAFEKALAIYQKMLSGYGNTLRIANAIKNLGVVSSQKSEHVKAIEYFNRALRIEKSLGQSDMRIANTINNLGVACARLGFWDEAMSHYMNALEIVNNLPWCEWHVDVADILYNIGVTNSILGCVRPAREYLKRSHRVFVACLGDGHAKSLDAKRFLKSLAHRQKMEPKKSRKRLYHRFRHRS